MQSAVSLCDTADCLVSRFMCFIEKNDGSLLI